MAADEFFRQPELAAEGAHLVLEQFAQRLDEAHVHALGQAADVVVALDGHRGAAREGHALDDVRIEGALRQELGRLLTVLGDLLRLGLEHVDEEAADRLALRLGVGDAVELAQKNVLRLHMHERDVVAVAEQSHDLLGLAQAQEPVVDENADELVGDRPRG